MVNNEVAQYELIRGKPGPTELHGYLQANLIANIGNAYHNRFNLFSELNLCLNHWRSVPDISLYPKCKINFHEDLLEVTTPPLCVIEILSSLPLQRFIEAMTSYFNQGVKSYWLIIPSLENIYVFSSPQNYNIFRSSQTLSDPALGIELELSKIFS